MGAKAQPSTGVWPVVKPFVNGGASGMLATCVIQPIDMIKVRIQLGQGSSSHVTREMLKNEGFGAFYKGLSAGLLRQATYTTARLGSFRYYTFCDRPPVCNGPRGLHFIVVNTEGSHDLYSEYLTANWALLSLLMGMP